MEEICDLVAASVSALVPFDRLSIEAVDVDAGDFVTLSASGIDVPERGPGDTAQLAATALAEAADTGSAVVVTGESPEELLSLYPGLVPLVDVGLLCILAVPMVPDEVPATFLTLATTVPKAYGRSDLAIGESIAGRLGAAVVAVHRIAALRDEADRQTAMAEVGRIAGSAADLADAFEQMSATLQTLVSFDRLEVAVLDATMERVTYAFVRGDEIDGWEVGRSFDIGDDVVGSVVRDQAGAIGTADSSYDIDSPPGFSSTVAAPLVFDDRVFCILTLRSAAADAYGESDVATLEQVGAQLTGLVASHATRTKLRLETELRGVLTQIDEVIDSAVDLDQVLPQVSEQVGRLIPFERAAIALLDHERDTAAIVHGAGAEIAGWGVGESIELGGQAYEALVHSGSAVASRSNTGAGSDVQLPGLQSFIATPLVSDGRTIAALVLGTRQESVYGTRHVELVRLIGARLTGGVAAAQRDALHQSELERDRALAELGRLVSNAPALADVFDEATEKVRVLIPFETFGVASLDAEGRGIGTTYGSRAGSGEGGGQLRPLYWRRPFVRPRRPQSSLGPPTIPASAPSLPCRSW